MEESPDDKCPHRSVPQTAKEKHDEEIQIDAPLGHAVSAEWNVKIIPEPA